jgi:hypothetical protein
VHLSPVGQLESVVHLTKQSLREPTVRHVPVLPFMEGQDAIHSCEQNPLVAFCSWRHSSPALQPFVETGSLQTCPMVLGPGGGVGKQALLPLWRVTHS